MMDEDAADSLDVIKSVETANTANLLGNKMRKNKVQIWVVVVFFGGKNRLFCYH